MQWRFKWSKEDVDHFDAKSVIFVSNPNWVDCVDFQYWPEGDFQKGDYLAVLDEGMVKAIGVYCCDSEGEHKVHWVNKSLEIGTHRSEGRVNYNNLSGDMKFQVDLANNRFLR